MDVLVSGHQMQALDRETIESVGIQGRVLMEVAGRAVAARAASVAGVQDVGGVSGWGPEPSVAQASASPRRVVVACGSGNNGGDGYVAARALAARGFQVEVYLFCEPEKVRGDARSALAALAAAERVEPVVVAGSSEHEAFERAVNQASVAVDALLGTGLKSEVRGRIADAIDVLNRAPTPVVAVDVPSGVDVDTGAVLGRAISARATVTFGFAKFGHYLHPGAGHRGALDVIDIGIPRRLVAEHDVRGRLLVPEDLPRMLPSRRADAHKGDFGHVLVMAGSPAKPGAAVLTLEGALRAGAGLVSWGTDTETLGRAPPRPPEVMLRLGDERSPEAWVAEALEHVTGVALGPGFDTTEPRRRLLAALLERAEVPLCVDADGLNLLAAHPQLWDRVTAPLVVTPHPKEMARLRDSTVGSVQADRLGAVTRLSAERGCVSLLKGAGTVVAEPGGDIAVVGAGGPELATGGTGDVLTGVVGGLLAQGIAPGQAAQLGALVHAAAGDLAAAGQGRASVVATDVAAAIGKVWKRWHR